MRINQKDLENVATRINNMTDNPTESYTKDKNGKYKANIGNYHIDHAYGGCALHKMATDGGGVHDVLRCGYVTKKELYNLMQAYINGLYDSKS